jgi:diketogulonate reductase-like aldo/keto reductase
MDIPNYTLKSGYKMPVLGLGTWQLTGEQCEKAVNWALEMGYPHIDTSDDYMNEERIGKALKGYDRSQIFITSKVDDSKLHKKDLVESCFGSLDRLGTDYLDLYLIHRPNPTVPIKESMIGMEELVDQKVVRSVGISNFGIKGTQDVMEHSNIPISNNQIKIHPYHYPEKVIEFLINQEIMVTAYSPLDTGGIVDDDLLSEIGKKYGRSASQVSLRWLREKGLIVIPKASSKDHLIENLDIFDWELSKEDSERITQSSNEILRG